MTKTRLTDLLLYTLAGLTLLSVIAALLVALHSFGAGVDRHDLLVVLLGLPGCAVLPFIPDALLARYTTLFDLVVLPWMLNCALALTLYFAARPFTANPHKPTL